MTLSQYDKKLLNFIYTLTKSQKFMTATAAAKHFNAVNNSNISVRTVIRWFKYLSKFGFGCYPYLNYSCMNLVVASVLLLEKEEAVGKILPNRFYVLKGVNHNDFSNYVLYCYAVPSEKLKDFEEFWRQAKMRKAVSYYKLFCWTTQVDFYQPFHEVFTSGGYIDIPKREIDNSYFLNLLKEKLVRAEPIQFYNIIKRYPIIVPIVLEYAREHWSSRKVWLAMKEKLGDKIKLYTKFKKKKKEIDGQGIKLVQNTMKLLHNNFKDFFQQMRIQHNFFYSDKAVVTNLFLTLKDSESIVCLADEISKRCLLAAFYLPLRRDKELMLFISTSNKQYFKIMEDIIPKYADLSADNKILYLNRKKTEPYWNDYRDYLKINYADTFDPATCSWKYDIEGSIRRLETLF